jgi:hypothetical protein
MKKSIYLIFLFILCFYISYSQDKVIKTDGHIIKGKITDLTKKSVKIVDSLNITKNINLKVVNKIIYQNGNTLKYKNLLDTTTYIGLRIAGATSGKINSKANDHDVSLFNCGFFRDKLLSPRFSDRGFLEYAQKGFNNIDKTKNISTFTRTDYLQLGNLFGYRIFRNTDLFLRGGFYINYLINKKEIIKDNTTKISNTNKILLNDIDYADRFSLGYKVMITTGFIEAGIDIGQGYYVSNFPIILSFKVPLQKIDNLFSKSK